MSVWHLRDDTNLIVAKGTKAVLFDSDPTVFTFVRAGEARWVTDRFGSRIYQLGSVTGVKGMTLAVTMNMTTDPRPLAVNP